MSSKLHTSRLGLLDSWSASGVYGPPRLCLFLPWGLLRPRESLPHRSLTFFSSLCLRGFCLFETATALQLLGKASAIERQIRVVLHALRGS